MKEPIKALSFVLALLLAGFTIPEKSNFVPQHSRFVAGYMQTMPLTGAWRLVSAGAGEKNDKITTVKILSDNYFMEAYYHLAGKRFVKSAGGTYTLKDGKYTQVIEYNTSDSSEVGKTTVFNYKLTANKWTVSNTSDNKAETWERIDQPAGESSPLAGAWRITAREQNGTMHAMQRGSRKTIKILSGSRFQWAAFNPDTKQFSGTGGGNYTTTNGKYTENIEFFPRDSSRVGAKLSFDFEVKGNEWHHKGLSSTGNKIYEIWTKE